MRTFTIENQEKGTFRTFRIETMPETGKFAPGRQVLSLLVGPDNSKNYKGFAFVDGNDVHVWNKCKGNGSGPSDFERFARLVEGLVIQNQRSKRYGLLEAIPCQRCGELMTVPGSIRRGIGPICAKR
jgi:hypothetical protein